MSDEAPPALDVRLSWPPVQDLERRDIEFAPWELRDVSTWEPESNEPRGVRPKQWVRDPGRVRWLRKEPRGSRPFEPAIETIVLRLAAAVGLPAPESYACEWDDSGRRARGIVVRSFADAMTEGAEGRGRLSPELQEGAVLLSSLDPSYQPANPAMRPQHSLARVRAALEHLEQKHAGARVVAPFLALAIFDAWVGNSDRHPHNWGIVWCGGQPSLAPIYDPAACLGAELTDGHALLDPERRATAIGPYVAKTRSGFGDGDQLIGQAEVIAALRTWPGWAENVQACLARFWTALDTSLVKFLATIPESWLPPPRRSLLITLLAERLCWLKLRTLEG